MIKKEKSEKNEEITVDTPLLSPVENDVKEALEEIEGYKYDRIMQQRMNDKELTYGDY